VHQAGTGLGRYVRTADDRHIARLERVLEQNLVELVALAGGDDLGLEAIAQQTRLGELVNQDQRALRRFIQIVLQFRMHADRLVGRQRPGRRRPDHSESRTTQMGQTEGGGQLPGMVLMDLEGNVDGRRVLVLILDFCFRQRRSAVQTPIDRLQPWYR
jgi:hypothetical protein